MPEYKYFIKDSNTQETHPVYVFMEYESEETVSINIRYDHPYDTSFDMGGSNGHVRIEIKNSIVVEELCPKTTNYERLLADFLRAFQLLHPSTHDFVKNAFQRKRSKVTRF
jgi:hypothetical protein